MTEVKNKDEVLNNLFSKLLPIFNEYFQESSNSITKQIELKEEIKNEIGNAMEQNCATFKEVIRLQEDVIQIMNVPINNSNDKYNTHYEIYRERNGKLQQFKTKLINTKEEKSV